MAKFIAIEGPEGSGKSTLVKEIQTAWQGPSHAIHFAKQGSTDPQFVADRLEDIVNLPNNYLIIFDRCWLSDAVYSELLGNREPEWSPEEVRGIEHIAQVNGVVLILLCGSHYPNGATSKIGVPIFEEVAAYHTFASSNWIRMWEPTAQEVICLL